MSPRATQGRQQSEPVLLKITKAAPIYELVSNNETYQVCGLFFVLDLNVQMWTNYLDLLLKTPVFFHDTI